MGIFSGNFYSESLAMTTRIQVIFPDLSNDVTPVITGTPRVLYLLHGLGGDCEEWTRFSKIEYYAKKYNFIIILPEVQRSFYCDTSYGPRYFTYIADELPEICWTVPDILQQN
jgi:S-formylglutathione hydrolase FrmB